MTLVVTDDLMRRCEQARVAAYSLRFDAVRRGSEPPEGLAMKMFGDAWAFSWGTFDRVMGLAPDQADQLDEIIAWYAESGRRPVFDLLPTEDNQELTEALARQGWYQRRTQAVLASEPQGTSVSPDVLPGVTVEPVTPESYDLFVRIYIAGRDWGPDSDLSAWKRWITDQYRGEHWRLFLARVDGEPAGAGTLALVGAGAGVLTNASTDPKHRGRGCHRKLLQHRLATCASEGMDLAISDTTVNSGSQRNMQRAGMVLACHLVQWHPLAD